MKTITNSELSFNLKDFNTEKSTILDLLRAAKHLGKFKRTEEIDNFFSQQPSYAFKYVKKILINSYWDSNTGRRVYKDLEKARLSIENEKVFLKNIKYAIGYLRATGQKCFRDEKTQQRFENKIYKPNSLSTPGAAFDYAKFVLKGRIPEDKENIFLESSLHIFSYSRDVLKGFFPDSIHKKILLLTFNNEHGLGGINYEGKWRNLYMKQDFSTTFESPLCSSRYDHLPKDYSYYRNY